MTDREAIETIEYARAFNEKHTQLMVALDIAIQAIKERDAAVDVDKAIKFCEDYSFKDSKEVYTNGSMLIPLFRVKQAFVDKAYNGFFQAEEDGE